MYVHPLICLIVVVPVVEVTPGYLTFLMLLMIPALLTAFQVHPVVPRTLSC